MAVSPGVCREIGAARNRLLLADDALQWMKTELGGGEMADLTPEVAAKAFLDVVYRPNQETNGKFGNVFVEGYQNAEGPNRYDGKDSPW